MQPSTGKLYAKSKIYFDNATFDTSTTPTTVTTEAAGLYAYDETGYRYPVILENTHNLWIGAGQTTGQHHTGETYISAGYDNANSVGFSTIKISVPNATNDGATNYSVWHSGNLTPYTHPTYTAKSSGLYKITVDGTGHVSATAAVAKGDIPALDYLPLTGGTVTGDVTLKSTSGNSPQLIFQRGTLIDNLNDWKIYVKSGGLYFAQSTANASSETWTDKMYFHPSDGKLYVGTKAVLTAHPTITTDTDTTSTASPAHGGTFTTVDSVTRDTNGHVTKINVKTVTLPASGNTDTKVTQNILATSVTDKYPLLVSYYKIGSTTTTAQTANRVDAVYVQPSTGTITATNFVGTVNSYSIGASVPSAAVFTDENVKQSVSTTTDYRPIALGKHTWTTGSIPSTDPTTVTDQIYGTSNLYMKPSTGSLFTKGYLECVTNNSGLWLTDSSSHDFGAVYCGSNFWIGAANSSSRAHTGVTYISTGYDTTNQCGYSTIFVSIPNADNSGQLAQNGSFGVLHKGNTSVTQVLTSGTKIATVSLGADSTDLYAPTNTDTKVNVTLATTSKAYLLATTTAPTSSAQAVTSVGDTGVYLTSSAGVLHATTFEGSLNGTITVTETHGDGTTPTTQKTYYVPFMVDKQSTNYIRANDGIRYATYDGDTTASPKTPGTASLRLGNNKTLNDTGNMRGSLLLFGSGADYIQVLPTTLTSYRTIYFPDEGGTIALKTQADINEMINLLSEGTSIPVDNDFYVSQYVNGGTTTTTYHRRSVLALWQYMKSKMTNGSNVSFSTDSTTKVLTISASDANVTQTATSTDANYEVLFSNTADNTTRTEGARKSSAVTLNPSSGNLTTTGAFVLKEGSYTGTITQNTLTANRTWTFPKHASGIIHIEQRANFYDDTTGVTSTPWQKVASLTTGAASTDRTATFIVAANYSGDVDKKFGIVQCHLRTNGSKVFSSAELTWLYKSPQLFLSDIVLLYKSVANTSTTIEIWAKSIRRYSGYTFTLLDEHDRKGVISGQWELTTNNGATGSASLPSGFTSKNSRILSNGTTLFDGTVSSSTVPDPSIPLQYAITNADYDWQSFSMLIMCIRTSNSNSIDEWTNIVIPWQLFCSDVTTQYYVPKGISDLSSAAALMAHPTIPGQGIVIDVTRGSWSGSKRVVLIGIQ